MEGGGPAPASSVNTGPHGGNAETVSPDHSIRSLSWSLGLDVRVVRWRKVYDAFFKAAIVCSVCGIALLGGSSHTDWTVAPLGTAGPTVAPAALGSAFISPLTQCGTGFWKCSSCSADKHHGQFLVLHPPGLQRNILRSDPLDVQVLATLDVGLCITRRLAGFAHGQLTGTSLLEQPLVRWTDGVASWSPTPAITALHLSLMRTHPLMQRFLPIMEAEHMFSRMPVVSQGYVCGIIGAARDRGPLTLQDRPMPFILSAVWSNQALTHHQAQSFDAGGLVERSEHLQERAIDAVAGLDLTLQHDTRLTIEQLLFPMLFPHNQGTFNTSISFAEYLMLRFKSLFSLWTLYKPYLLFMVQIRQALQIAQSCSMNCLESALASYRRTHPGCSDEDALRHCLTWTLPGKVCGSPTYHRQQLADLLVRVETWGMPSFFLTLTADECSQLRWTQFAHLEEFLHHIDSDLTWQDAPVECARHFVARCRAFLRDHILGTNGILGKVKHHVIRWEAQRRGSLHAHILLWVAEDDVNRVADEIMAYIPAAYDSTSRTWIEPNVATQPNEHALFKIVMRKQLHSCTAWTGKAAGCRDKHGRCKVCFPFAPCSGTTYNAASQRYMYRRLRHEDRIVIPYHPTVALLWNAHSNLQRITRRSYYVLKYAAKSEPTGRVHFESAAVASLNLANLSQAQLKVISSAIQARPISPAEAALM